jgi:predicted anti-sigma-YlaC factor YlaD
MANCAEIKEQLALWAGGDLSQEDLAAVQEHLDRCDDCQAAAESWKKDQVRVNAILADAPAPVLGPAFLAHAIDTALASAEPQARSPRSRSSRFLRFALPAAAVLALLMIWTGIRPSHETPIAPLNVADGVTSWDELQDAFGGCLSDPIEPRAWQAESTSGLVAVLSPSAGGDGYVVADVIESGNLARLRNYPWLEQRLKWYRRFGEHDREIVVATCATGELDRSARRLMSAELRGRFTGTR